MKDSLFAIQAQRNAALMNPHPYSSPIMGDWLFVYGYDNPVLYWSLR